ncbi:capsular biosynthesis protein [Burkholderia gladioli]|uniref:Capsular biosynthesis protein n=1 Tax=Burkholderia gladioli TaxID=28095 RepID=A0AAP8S2J0_BURGA|nr:capsular biosynthesis protein [Burkholderia gladioli]AJW97133.1 capsule polysaccharide biosynthesis family protein [Burkholderia gladioli]ASD78167.1 capsular biosynthesis protein [Burkholderia gladioli pv. gladioli]AWY56590.1 capsular biosynthesis protein [Burkholderia gladioli pv. gladioli]KGC17973.1 capsule polysaccharide biosynthesis family protein [Burkholderia gladioli]MBJ9673975.1 capsular biosynthesis protein [Burkholderia gladioli]
MSEYPAPLSGSTDPQFDAIYLAHGYRLLGWLTRRSRWLWPEARGGRLLATVARRLRPDTQAAYAGPIAPRASLGLAPLSWFSIPLECGHEDPLGVAIEQALSASARHDEGRTQALMQRLLDSDALHPRRKAAQLPDAEFMATARRRVLLIDERLISGSSPRGYQSRRIADFRAMVDEALASHPDAEFWLAPSSDPGRGPWLSSRCGVLPRELRVLRPEYSLRAWLPYFSQVYTVGAAEGMGAILADRPTFVYGRPYYAGWGFTTDLHAFPKRHARPTLAAWFDTTFMRLTHYLDTEREQLGTLEHVLDALQLQYQVAERFRELDHVVGLRFQWWKRRLATPYLSAGGGTLRWARGIADIGRHECAALWGARLRDGAPRDTRHYRIEDGFIHSAELGSDMSPPCSQVIDGSNLYFDASAPSDLTRILNTAGFDAAELARAAALRHSIVEFGITKYNLGRHRPTWPRPVGRRVILVPGQVADDASIRLGTGAVNTAEGLLAAVRERRPTDCIVYKPHPDVLSGNRNGLVQAQRLADVVDLDSDIVSLIEAADEVHTLSSLSGFDALLRGKPVFTYGLPFYAGWGLTDDAISPQPWRERVLTLDMLTAGTLIRYPIYWNWRLALYTTPEAVVRRLATAARRPLRAQGRNWRRPALKAFRWITNALIHLGWRYRQAGHRRNSLVRRIE